MNSEQLTQILKEAFPEAEVAVRASWEIRPSIVDDQFDGKRTITRQQAVYAPLNSYIASGEVHAVTIRAMTKTNGAKQAFRSLNING